MTHRFRLAVASTLTLVLLGGAVLPAAAADATTDRAADWLGDQQQDDGSFEIAAPASAFETPDAILAIAENAQTTSTWSTTEARAAVQALDANAGGDSGTPLEWADDFLSGWSPDAGIAAKFITLVAAPLGVSTTAFDPADDGEPVNLQALMDAGELADHSYGAGVLNATLYALLAQAVLGREAPDDTIAYLRDAQQENGGWNYAGDAGGTDEDVDTTALAVTALIANGVPPGDSAVASAMKFLANRHQNSGAWQSFGSDDPNSTALGLLAVTAAGWDPGTECWRDSSSPSVRATSFVGPASWLRSRQITTGAAADVGRFRSPNDGFGVNTFATSQALHGLLRSWLPVDIAALQPPSAFTDVEPCVWYSQAVAWMADNAISRSTSGRFGPNRAVLRGQAAALLWNTMDSPAEPTAHGFPDVPASAFYNDALDWAAAEGIVSGYPNGTYRPRVAVNRGRMVAMLWRMVGAPTGSPDNGFSDVPAGAPYREALDWGVANGIVTGFADGTYRPKVVVDRAEAAAMLFRTASTEPAWSPGTDLPSTIQFTP